MESVGVGEVLCGSYGGNGIEIATEHHQSGTGSSFTALLELPPSQAMELLYSTGSECAPADFVGNILNCSLACPPDTTLIERAAKYSVFATGGSVAGSGGNGEGGGGGSQDSLDTTSLKVKSEPADSNSNRDSISLVPNPTSMRRIVKTAKRKERDAGKRSTKKSKNIANDNSGDGEKLPYVHVRARRGQATDSHSLAERARREKINARMKLLQDLVPGCNKISGTALVLDEIINHVQNLQRQVEYLSMRLAELDPRIDFNLDSLVAAGNGSLMDGNFQSMMMPLTWPDVQMNGDRQQCQQQWHFETLTQPIWLKEGNHHNLITPENSLLSYESGNSASLHSSQLKMEL